MTGNRATGLRCPACPNLFLQRLPAGSDYTRNALAHAEQLGLEIPVHGPAALIFATLIAHAMIVHDELDLAEFLEAYLTH